MSDYKAKMHQIRFLLGLRPRPRWGAYSAPRTQPLFKGPTSKGMEGNGREGRNGKGEGRGEVEGGIWPTRKFWCGAPYVYMRVGLRFNVNNCSNIVSRIGRHYFIVLV